MHWECLNVATVYYSVVFGLVYLAGVQQQLTKGWDVRVKFPRWAAAILGSRGEWVDWHMFTFQVAAVVVILIFMAAQLFWCKDLSFLVVSLSFLGVAAALQLAGPRTQLGLKGLIKRRKRPTGGK
jgi:hypothetical protein